MTDGRRSTIRRTRTFASLVCRRDLVLMTVITMYSQEASPCLNKWSEEFWWKAASHVGSLLRIEWCLLQRTTQQWFTMLISWPDDPQNCHFPWRITTPSNRWFLGPMQVSSKLHLDRFMFWQGSRTWPTDRHTGRWTHIQIHKPTTLLRQLCYQNQLISTSVCSNSPRHASCMQYSLKRGVDTRRSREAGWRGVSSCTTPRKNVVLLELYNLAIKPFCVIFTVRFNFKLSTAALIFRHIPPFL